MNTRGRAALCDAHPHFPLCSLGGRSGASGVSHSLILSSLQSMLHSEHMPLVDALASTKLGLLPKRVIYLPLPGKEANIVRVLSPNPHKPPAFVPRGNNSWLFMTITSEKQDQLACPQPTLCLLELLCCTLVQKRQKSRPCPGGSHSSWGPLLPTVYTLLDMNHHFLSILVANANGIVIQGYGINVGSSLQREEAGSVRTWKHSWRQVLPGNTENQMLVCLLGPL